MQNEALPIPEDSRYRKMATMSSGALVSRRRNIAGGAFLEREKLSSPSSVFQPGQAESICNFANKLLMERFPMILPRGVAHWRSPACKLILVRQPTSYFLLEI